MLLVIAAVVTIAAWVFTIYSASAMSSPMPMPGGWSMSMAWMSMGHQSPLAHAAMFLVMWAVMMIARGDSDCITARTAPRAAGG